MFKSKSAPTFSAVIRVIDLYKEIVEEDASYKDVDSEVDEADKPAVIQSIFDNWQKMQLGGDECLTNR